MQWRSCAWFGLMKQPNPKCDRATPRKSGDYRRIRGRTYCPTATVNASIWGIPASVSYFTHAGRSSPLRSSGPRELPKGGYRYGASSNFYGCRRFRAAGVAVPARGASGHRAKGHRGSRFRDLLRSRRAGDLQARGVDPALVLVSRGAQGFYLPRSPKPSRAAQSAIGASR